MSNSKKVTFDEAYDAAEKHMKTVDPSQFSADKHHLTSLAQDGQPNLCKSYSAVKPLLFMVALMPFLPANWRNSITLFLKGLDAICPLS